MKALAVSVRFYALPLCTCLFVACTTVGPDYAGPPKSGATARFARQETLAADAPLDDWWRGLNDPQLDDLVQRALAASPSLAVAEAKLRHARAALGLERANAAPKGSASLLYAHARTPALSLGGSSSGSSNSSTASSDPSRMTTNLYSEAFDASWEIDLFGGQRRAIEGARASLEAAEANLADAQVSLTAEVAQAYVNVRDCQRRMALNAQSIERQQQELELTEERLRAGTATRLDVARLRNQLESTRADALPLTAQLDGYRDELAMLLDELPGDIDATLNAPGPVPLPPAHVQVGDPTDMLRRRPDIRAAERTLAARNAAIGQAVAARFPKVSLFGLIGVSGTTLSALGHLDDFSAIAAPQLSWNFLDFGRAKTRVEEARADQEEALADYRQAVGRALEDAEDAMSRYRNRLHVVATLARSQAAADEAEAITRERYAAGTASLIDLLDAERQQIAAQQSLSQAEARLTTDYVSLQKSLGLGWRTPPAPAAPHA